MGLRALLLIVAVACFLLAAFKVDLADVNLLYVGLAAFAGSFLAGDSALGGRR